MKVFLARVLSGNVVLAATGDAGAVGSGAGGGEAQGIDARRRQSETSSAVKHVIEIPDEIEQALEKRASETGDDVAHIIETAVAVFVRNGAQASAAGRRPDPPVDAAESVAPCELPRTDPQPVAIDTLSRRMPDPIADLA